MINPTYPASAFFLSLRRIRGVFFRHYYLWFRNPEYFLDTFWQPIVDILIWGFVSFYLSKVHDPFRGLVSAFMGAVILWTVLRRGQHEITFSLMEDAWSRNLQNMIMTPVKMAEYYFASILFGLIKLVFELSLMGILVAFIFKFNVLTIGWIFFPFALSLLLTGWAIGLFVNSAIIYFGRGLVALSWIIAFVLQPFSCVFYPLKALPAWAQIPASLFPATWAFEGMRKGLFEEKMDWGFFMNSLGLNSIYLILGFLVFNWVMRKALEKGLLMKLEW